MSIKMEAWSQNRDLSRRLKKTIIHGRKKLAVSLWDRFS